MSENALVEEQVCAYCERPLDPTVALEEARRMLIAYPKVQPEMYTEVRTENLLASIAGSLLVIADALAAPVPHPAATDPSDGGAA